MGGFQQSAIAVTVFDTIRDFFGYTLEKLEELWTEAEVDCMDDFTGAQLFDEADTSL